jgi:putrescine importer
MAATADRDTVVPGLRRALKLRHLILYGIIIIQPTAPMSIYGVVSNAARGSLSGCCSIS